MPFIDINVFCFDVHSITHNQVKALFKELVEVETPRLRFCYVKISNAIKSLALCLISVLAF